MVACKYVYRSMPSSCPLQESLSGCALGDGAQAWPHCAGLAAGRARVLSMEPRKPLPLRAAHHGHAYRRCCLLQDGDHSRRYSIHTCGLLQGSRAKSLTRLTFVRTPIQYGTSLNFLQTLSDQSSRVSAYPPHPLQGIKVWGQFGRNWTSPCQCKGANVTFGLDREDHIVSCVCVCVCVNLTLLVWTNWRQC